MPLFTTAEPADADFVNVLSKTELFHAPGGSHLKGGNGATLTATLKAEQLITATLEFGKVQDAAQQFQPPGTDPFTHCMVCAKPRREELDDSEFSEVLPRLSPPPAAPRLRSNSVFYCITETAVPQDYPVAIATDAINSANLLSSSAGAESVIEHTTDTYFADPARRVREAFASGTLRKDAVTRAEAAEERAAEGERAAEEARLRGEGGADRDGAHACTTALSCNRETANNATRGEMWITGTVAAACMHVVPGLKLAIAMFGPEEHYYYDELLRDAFKARPGLDTVYLDLACRYKLRFEELKEELVEDDILTDAAAVKLLLPWMHGFDHDLECQLKHSGMYTVSPPAAPPLPAAQRSCIHSPDATDADVLLAAGCRPSHRGADGAAVVAHQAFLQEGALHDQGALARRHELGVLGDHAAQAAPGTQCPAEPTEAELYTPG